MAGTLIRLALVEEVGLNSRSDCPPRILSVHPTYKREIKIVLQAYTTIKVGCLIIDSALVQILST